MARGQGEHDGRTLAEKVEWLIDHMWPSDAPPARTNAEAAEAISAATGVEMSSTSIWKIRTGRGPNPTLKTLVALAEFFKVPFAYFGPGEDAETAGDQVALLALLREKGFPGSSLRELAAMSPESRQMVAEMISSAARMEQRRGGNNGKADPDASLLGR